MHGHAHAPTPAPAESRCRLQPSAGLSGAELKRRLYNSTPLSSPGRHRIEHCTADDCTQQKDNRTGTRQRACRSSCTPLHCRFVIHIMPPLAHAHPRTPLSPSLRHKHLSRNSAAWRKADDNNRDVVLAATSHGLLCERFRGHLDPRPLPAHDACALLHTHTPTATPPSTLRTSTYAVVSEAGPTGSCTY